MSLAPNHQNAVSAAASALQAVGIAQTNSQEQQTQADVQAAAAQYAQQHLNNNQFYQQQVQQAQQRVSQQAQHQYSTQEQHQQLLNAVQQQQYNQAAQQLAQHLPQAAVHSFQPTAPQSEFQTREDLITYIHQYARDNGFGIVISHSNEKAIYFTCELGGTYRNKRNINDKERKRKLTTRKINCPFSMVANCKKNDHEEIVKWVLRITQNEHNHDKLNLNESFPMLRRRNPNINRQIRELYLKGNKPLVIEKMLKSEFKDILINREDIYNETRKMKREEKLKARGLSPQDDPTQEQLHAAAAAAAAQSVNQVSSNQLKDEAFDQNLPNLLQANGIQLNQYVSQALQQQSQQNQQQQQHINRLSQNQYGLQQGSLNSANQNVVSQAIANAQENPPQQDTNLSNIDINLVKQQGL